MELLSNRKCHIVLTGYLIEFVCWEGYANYLLPCTCCNVGFSFGGLLACAIAACVWNSPYISSNLLKENLACITFAQPHIPVPWLPEVARECPDLVSAIHTVYWEGDPVPRLARFLNECCSSLGSEESKASVQLKMRDQVGLVRGNNSYTYGHSVHFFHQSYNQQPFQDPMTSLLFDHLGKVLEGAARVGAYVFEL